MKTIKQKLAITPEEYEMMILDLYTRWCESVTINFLQFQQVLANAAVNKWFLIELTKCEVNFHELTERYTGSKTVSTNDLLKCYRMCTDQMFNIRPMPLLESLKVKGSLSYRCNGSPIFTNLNQN